MAAKYELVLRAEKERLARWAVQRGVKARGQEKRKKSEQKS